MWGSIHPVTVCLQNMCVPPTTTNVLSIFHKVMSFPQMSCICTSIMCISVRIQEKVQNSYLEALCLKSNKNCCSRSTAKSTLQDSNYTHCIFLHDTLMLD